MKKASSYPLTKHRLLKRLIFTFFIEALSLLIITLIVPGVTIDDKPLINFPSLGATELEEASASYADGVAFLFLVGFMLAKAMENSNLHCRFALNMLRVVGTNPKYIIAAFMVSIGLLGAWISNTAITMLMLPVAVAVISQFRNPDDRAKWQ
jgi:solute carrier family 13 (sodium-dependent dicarboxylate transporter), member 2/3/5